MAPVADLSLCMIVRNEAKHLEACLASARPWVGEIVVVDTGSSDDSRAIASRWGARLFEAPWRDDFSLARNRSLQEARCPWILVLDADERLEVDDPCWSRPLLAAPEHLLGFRLPITLHPDWTPTEVLRLFRNRADLRYSGVIHEQLSLQQQPESCVQPLQKVQLQHVPYDRAHFESKLSRNCEHLERHRLAHPHDHFQLWHLARIQLEIGNLERAALLLDEMARAIASPGQSTGTRPGALASARLRLEAFRYELALARTLSPDAERGLCSAAALAFPRCPLFSLGAARASRQLGRNAEALQWYRHTYRLWRSGRYDRTLIYRHSQIGPGALMAAGQLLAILGRQQLAGRVVGEAARQASALAAAAAPTTKDGAQSQQAWAPAEPPRR